MNVVGLVVVVKVVGMVVVEVVGDGGNGSVGWGDGGGADSFR